MNKRGTDKILSLYWFAILIIIAGGVTGMVYVFYGSPYDIREIEANLMIDRIADCLSSQGRINSEIIQNGNFDSNFEENFLEKCHLNFNVEDVYGWRETVNQRNSGGGEFDGGEFGGAGASGSFEGQGQYYLEVDFYNFENPETSVYNIKKGNNNWLSSCVLQEEKEYERLAKCVTKSFYSLDDIGNQYIIKILGVVRKTEKNVKG